MSRFPRRAQAVVGTTLLVACAILVVAFYGALIALIVELWSTKNEVTFRVAMTVFALAWFWPIGHAIAFRRARRRPAVRAANTATQSMESDDTVRPPKPEIDLVAMERRPEPAAPVDAGERGRAASA